MRTARLVGLSPDGRSLIVATDAGEELAIAADDRLRAAVRGDRPRLGQLEFEMETSLSPRDIQTRIRAGASLEDVARVAGIEMERVERFAAPVLAERDYVAITAMSSSVRRRGETSGHRNLRITVTERLVTRGIDIDTIDWDSYRLEDGRWTVTADYHSGEAARHAEFTYDPRGRFSVAANDEARWLLGEQSAAKGPQPGRRRPEGGTGEDDSEPTLDLNDELALIRATQELDRTVPAPDPTPAVAYFEQSHEASEPTIAVVRPLYPVADLPPEPADEPADEASEESAQAEADSDEDDSDEDEAAPVESAQVAEPAAETAPADSPLSTLDQMLGREDYTEDSVQVYAGLSDASAVPETDAVGWEPAIVVNYPVEPSEFDDSESTSPTGEHRLPGTDEPGPPTPLVDGAGRAEEEQEFDLEAAEPPAPKPAKRKRASVPSWDEIMFGGPRPPG
jgi:hypothetical protein